MRKPSDGLVSIFPCLTLPVMFQGCIRITGYRLIAKFIYTIIRMYKLGFAEEYSVFPRK